MKLLLCLFTIIFGLAPVSACVDEVADAGLSVPANIRVLSRQWRVDLIWDEPSRWSATPALVFEVERAANATGPFKKCHNGYLPYCGHSDFLGEAVKAFQTNTANRLNKRDWNTIKIHCQDGHVRTWLNGVKQADFTDPEGIEFRSGVIGLQLHSGKRCEVSWCNIVLTPLEGATKMGTVPVPDSKEVLSADQLAYLDRLMRDTFAFVDHACDPGTGIPTNFQYPGGHTNSTPVGLYIASLAVANRLGILSDADATQRFEKVFSSMERVHQKHGFFPNFFPADLRSIPTNGVMVISDYNIYPAGLVVARQVWPQYADRISAYLDSIEWERLYNKTTNTVVSGYDLGTQKAAYSGLWLASDARCAVMMMIGSGVAPPSVWKDMTRGPIQTSQGPVLQPGINFGGTYIAGITGLFLPEHDTRDVGETVGNLGWWQYEFSRRRNYPLWGWSNCYIVGRDYTAGGMMPEWNVSPHSLALLLQYYPRHVTATLQKMERLGGSVPPAGYESKAWGLRGCYDMERNQWGKKYLQLEQGMMFLGLANYLHDGIVRKLFTSDPLIRKGIELSKPFIHHDPKLVARWAERDSQAIKKTPLRLASKWADTVDSVTALDLAGMVIHQPKLLSVRPDNGMVHLASSGGGDWAQTVVGIPGNGMDISNLDRIEVDVDNLQGNTPQPGYIKMFLVDKFGQSRYAYLKLNSKATHYSIPARDVYGFLMDNDKLAYVNLTFDRRPAFRPNMRFHPSDFSMRLKAIRLITKK